MIRHSSLTGAPLVINRQNALAVNLPAVRSFVRRLRAALRVRQRDFTVCFVDDQEIRRLNSAHRGKPRPTDVLSFSWKNAGGNGHRPANPEYQGYLGDVVISVETARRNARAEGHSTQTEISWLMLHGALHLLGYDHETDHGEMTTLELSLRERLARVDFLARQRKNRSTARSR